MLLRWLHHVSKAAENTLRTLCGVLRSDSACGMCAMALLRRTPPDLSGSPLSLPAACVAALSR